VFCSGYKGGGASDVGGEALHELRF
jgi:hypothetical protein